MKIILQRSVENLGDPGEIVTVKDGYARNYLIPRGLAVPASKGATRHVESLQKAYATRIALLKGAAETAAGNVGGAKVTITAKAGEDGKLFGSVTAADIAAAVDAKTPAEVTVDKRAVLLEESIKVTGEHAVKVKLHPEVETEILVEVVAE